MKIPKNYFEELPKFQVKDWDGYGSDAVIAKSVELVKKFIKVLPESDILPSWGVDPDGMMNLDWYTEGRSLNISFCPSGNLIYGLYSTPIKGDGGGSECGVVKFVDQVPGKVIELLMKLATKDGVIFVGDSDHEK